MRRTFLGRKAVLVLLAVLTMGSVIAQDDDQEQYRIEYEAYQKAVGEGPEALLGFIKQFPKSTLVAHAEGEIKTKMNEAFQGNDLDAALGLAEKFLALRPNDLASLFFASNVHYRQQNFPQAISYAEKLYDLNDAGTKGQAAFIIAFSAVQSGDEARISKYGDEACASLAPKDCYSIYGELMRINSQKRDLSTAIAYSKKLLEGLEGAKSSNSGAEWNKYVTDKTTMAYALQASQDFQRQRWSAALKSYRRLLNYSNARAVQAEARYHIGMSYWKMGQIDPGAMQEFAKGSKLGSSDHAKACRQHLEELYKSTHNGSLAGLDEFIDGATGGE